ncbi:phage/plasmid replication domain-containing protein [Thiobaca trueperi]|uniref:Phage replication protein CRI n=1 Tax=Thiobaca trueperi TaxID=127458 RepID=A0A4R3N4E3_9GAMM|nr:phage/plasmid replication protein [Thiobaca trueperi]TCT23855.1 phage replication protein CRI [Thiobaca trueperi]
MDLSNPALHVDFLDVWQQHDEAPEWGSSRRLDIDLKTGELQYQTVKSDQLKGSWESSLMIRSFGGRVQVQGNPSKWGRSEAVALGCPSIFEAVKVYNGVLAELNLPLFHYPDRIQVLGDGGAIDRTVLKGPRVSRIDIAANLILGSSESVAHYLNWLLTQRVGHRGQPFSVKGELSVLAGSRRTRQRACYGKADEVLEQIKRWRRKRIGDIESVTDYLNALRERLHRDGWVRDELRLYTDYLSRANLAYIENWSDETMKEQWQAFKVDAQEVGAVIDWKSEVVVRLVARGVGERAARQRLEVLLAWMGGIDVGPGNGRSQATFYRIAKDLREVVGVDIRSRPNVVTLGSRSQQLARPVTARVATLADVQALYEGLPELSDVA